MKSTAIIDTGLLVALINRREQSHDWVKTQLANIASPLLTCEAVITESCFLLRKIHGGEDAVLSLVNCGKIKISFCLSEKVVAIRELMKRYQSVPMSLADSCLVYMAEQYPQSLVFTLDNDFRIYRKNRYEAIDLIIPDDR